MMTFCRHKHQALPRRDEEGEYRRCLDCGNRIPWAFADGPEFHPRVMPLTQAEQIEELEKMTR